VLSHPVALRQCEEFLENLGEVNCQAYTDTAEAVIKVIEDGDPHQAAIASREAAELHGLQILKEGIADHSENFTRFWIIAREPASLENRIPCKTSIMLVTDHREGALAACLSALADNGINMTKLESRPRRGVPWEYKFYLDVEGNVRERRMIRALEALRDAARHVRILGCYPRSERDLGSV